MILRTNPWNRWKAALSGKNMNGHSPGTTRIPRSRQNSTAFWFTDPLPAARYIQVGELQKFAADRRIAGDSVKGTVLADRQLQRDQAFLASLLEGCGRLERILEGAVARFDEAIQTTRETPLP